MREIQKESTSGIVIALCSWDQIKELRREDDKIGQVSQLLTFIECLLQTEALEISILENPPMR